MPTCATCRRDFEVPAHLAERFPDWTPPECPDCFRRRSAGAAASESAARVAGEEDLTLDEVLARYTEGPDSGVFTDGSADPNPGPGGWGAVYVEDGEIVACDWGREPETTNNRMELTALLRGIELVPPGTPAQVHTDSRLVVDTVTEWAPAWEARGWRRKAGPVKNLDLVRPLVERLRERPELELVWLPGHARLRWNEYADSLSTAWRRERL
jgi:ribonuclease HI